MNYDWEDYDFFDGDYEPSQEEVIITDLKEHIKSSVKEEIKNKLKRFEEKNNSLKKENRELKKKVANLNQLENELKEKIASAKRDVYKEEMKNLIECIPNVKEAFSIDYDYIKQEKCNCCDENRGITFTDALGRKYKVACKCNDSKKVYVYKKSTYTFYLEKGNRDLRLYVKMYREDDNKYVEINKDKNNFIEKFDENNPPENYYNVLFTDENEAKKYVDWLNKKEQEKE